MTGWVALERQQTKVLVSKRFIKTNYKNMSFSIHSKVTKKI
jgi:hypothetical protein